MENSKKYTDAHALRDDLIVVTDTAENIIDEIYRMTLKRVPYGQRGIIWDCVKRYGCSTVRKNLPLAINQCYHGDAKSMKESLFLLKQLCHDQHTTDTH